MHKKTETFFIFLVGLLAQGGNDSSWYFVLSPDIWFQDCYPQKSDSSSSLSSLSHPDSTFSTVEKSTWKKLKVLDVFDNFGNHTVLNFFC